MRLYYDDAYTSDFSARIIERTEHNGHPAVVLNQTYFYPTGGGQPNDTGFINGVAVIDVLSRENGDVLHILEKPVMDDEIRAQIDWKRRFDHMQHHTGQHILTQAFVQTTDAHTVGFHLSPDTVTIDLDKPALTADKLDAAEALANQIIQQDRIVRARLINPTDAEGVRMRKMPEKIYTDGLRVVDIEGFDMTACGGTHVATTGQIGLVKIIKVEKRGEKLRIEFRCGGRAIQDYSEKHTIINIMTNDLTCGIDEIPQAVNRLRDELKTAQQSLKAVRNRLLDYEANDLLNAPTLELNGMKVIKIAFDRRDTEEVRFLASKLAESPSTVALLGTSGEKAQIIFARSKNLSYDMNSAVKTALNVLGARGGGRPEMAQGGGIPATVEQITEALDTAQKTLEGSL